MTVSSALDLNHQWVIMFDYDKNNPWRNLMVA